MEIKVPIRVVIIQNEWRKSLISLKKNACVIIKNKNKKKNRSFYKFYPILMKAKH